MTTPTPSFDKEKYELRSQVIPLKTDKLSQLEFNESFLIGRSSSKKSKKNRALNPDNFLFDDAAISREHLLGYLYRIDLGTMEYKLPLVKDVSQHGSMILKYGSDTAFKLEKNTFVPLQEGDIIGLVLTRVNAPTKKSSDNIFKNTKLQFQVFFNQEDSRLNLIKLNTSPFAKDFFFRIG
ncbi:hypothetical protein CANARDRAFT_121633 [[Candida] arabinofermentans NRRL YB-2248]|uniref:FHA domain-containing protein n=1 Tax=[Candida] arabinofermentans NRRL YB-2248 TaxID=983967 RepID=A0A1E4T5G9_9ASCO|nr:hypothetical protein CANARDRAFT_121633 [[Candida] arabinofermentans NRRL YB-2248]